jgi:hypothetical protein
MEARILAASMLSVTPPERPLPLRPSDALRRSPLALCWPAAASDADAAAATTDKQQHKSKDLRRKNKRQENWRMTTLS